MRRFFVWILVGCLLAISGTTVLAEGTVDLSGYSDADLLALSAEVQKEVAARGIERTAHLMAGTYVGGGAIPTGNYILTVTAPEDGYGTAILYSVNDRAGASPSKLYERVSDGDSYTGFITVEEGDVLILDFPCTLTISAGVMFGLDDSAGVMFGLGD